MRLRIVNCGFSLVAAAAAFVAAGCTATTPQQIRDQSRFTVTYDYDQSYQLAHKKLVERINNQGLVGRAFDDYDSFRIVHEIYCELGCSTIYRQEYAAAELRIRYLLDLTKTGEAACRIELSALSLRDREEVDRTLRAVLGEPESVSQTATNSAAGT